MSANSKKATIYLDPALHEALCQKSKETDQSLSDLVNDAVRCLLAEEAEDLADIEALKDEPRIPFDEFVNDLRARGRI